MANPPSFETDKGAVAAPVIVDFKTSRSILLIAFAGMTGKIGMPIFEFFNLTSELGQINRIFLRDVHRIWYHAGLPGIARDLPSIASYLRNYTEQPSTRRVVVIGNSGGGYAAVLFGHMLQVNEVHAFFPKTLLDPVQRMLALDLPSRLILMQSVRMRLLHRNQARYFDLRDVLSESPAGKTRFHIYYSAQERADRQQATRLESLAGLFMHPYAAAGHNLVQHLKETGELSQILQDAVHG